MLVGGHGARRAVSFRRRWRSRTRDSGRSFEVLSKGLPPTHAYDPVWPHALDIDPSGEGLAFGSTTGGLWGTENGGDSWRIAEARLAPVCGCTRHGRVSPPWRR